MWSGPGVILFRCGLLLNSIGAKGKSKNSALLGCYDVDLEIFEKNKIVLKKDFLFRYVRWDTAIHKFVNTL